MTIVTGTIYAEGPLNLEPEIPLVPFYIAREEDIVSMQGMNVDGHHITLSINGKLIHRWQLLKQIEHVSEEKQAIFLKAWERDFREEKGRYNVKESKATKSITDWRITPDADRITI